MADILIRGMEMPENCFDCPIFDNFCQERCGVTGTLMHGEIDPQRETLTDCPLLPLPEGHGRLGDLDALLEKGMKLSWSVQKWVQEVDIVTAPTIVPAEGTKSE